MSEVNETSLFPPEFDIGFIRRRRPWLRLLPETMVRRRWEARGRAAGLQATAPAVRADFLRLFSAHRPILEIGPLDRPMVRGEGVAYFDVLDQAGLIEKVRNNPRRTGEVPPIDYVSPIGDLRIVDRKFRAVCSSHAIEHQPDLVKHLVDVADLLEDGGFYFVLMPDKRFCFDHFGPETTIADVVEAHRLKREVHGLRTIVQHIGLQTHNETMRHWRGDHLDPNYAADTPARVRRALALYDRSKGSYIDAHAWRFTPTSFRSTVDQMKVLGLTPFVPLRVYDTPHPRVEFAAILQKRL